MKIPSLIEANIYRKSNFPYCSTIATLSFSNIQISHKEIFIFIHLVYYSSILLEIIIYNHSFFHLYTIKGTYYFNSVFFFSFSVIKKCYQSSIPKFQYTFSPEKNPRLSFVEKDFISPNIIIIKINIYPIRKLLIKDVSEVSSLN